MQRGTNYLSATAAIMLIAFSVTAMADTPNERPDSQQSHREGLKIHHIEVPKFPGDKRISIYVHRGKGGGPLPHAALRLVKPHKAGSEGSCLLGREKLTPAPDGKHLLVAHFDLPYPSQPSDKSCSIVRDSVIGIQVSVISHHVDKRERITDKQSTTFHLPRPLRFALLGDSYAAGLGTAHYDMSDPELEPGAFRSSLSGMMLLVNALSESLAVDYINVTYAGGQVTAGTQKKVSSLIEFNDDETIREGPQLMQVRSWLDCKPIDFMIASIGGNEMYEKGNGKSGLKLLVRRVLNAIRTAGAIGKVRKKIETGLNSYRRDLRALLKHISISRAYQGTKLIMSTYPDLTKDEEGNYSRPKRRVNDKEKWFGTYSRKEMKFLYEEVLTPLNNIIKQECGTHDFCLVNDVMKLNPEIKFHGMPSVDPWFNRTRDSIAFRNKSKNKPGMSEAFHPTAKGQEEIYFKTLQKIVETQLANMHKVPEPIKFGNAGAKGRDGANKDTPY